MGLSTSTTTNDENMEEESMNLAGILEALMNELKIYEDDFDDDLSGDYKLTSVDDQPPLRDLVGDGYSAIDTDGHTPGGRVLGYIMDDACFVDDYSPEVTRLLLMLAMGRALTDYEEKLAEQMTQLCIYASESNGDLNAAIRSIRSDPDPRLPYMLPVQATLLLLRAEENRKTRFLRDVKNALHDEIEVVKILWNVSSDIAKK